MGGSVSKAAATVTEAATNVTAPLRAAAPHSAAGRRGAAVRKGASALPPERRAVLASYTRHILVDDEAAADHLLAELQQQPEQQQQQTTTAHAGASASKAGEADDAPLARLREQFAALARRASRCPSAKDGGRLGWVSRDETTRAFEDAVLNERSVPLEQPRKVRSEYGWHVVLVERRSYIDADTAAMQRRPLASDAGSAAGAAEVPSSTSSKAKATTPPPPPSDLSEEPAYQDTLRRLANSITARPMPGALAPGALVTSMSDPDRHRRVASAERLPRQRGTDNRDASSPSLPRLPGHVTHAQMLGMLTLHAAAPDVWDARALAAAYGIEEERAREALARALVSCRVYVPAEDGQSGVQRARVLGSMGGGGAGEAFTPGG